MASVALNKAREKIETLKKSRTRYAGKIREMNLKARAQRGMHTTGAVLGGGLAAVADYEIEGFELGETEIPVSAIGGVGLRFAAEMMDQEGAGADFLASVGDGAIAGATYKIVGDKYSSWRDEE